MKIFEEQPTATLRLIGLDSGMGAILGTATRAAYAAGWDPKAVDLLRRECFAREYNEFLCLLMDVFDVPYEDEVS